VLSDGARVELKTENGLSSAVLLLIQLLLLDVSAR